MASQAAREACLRLADDLEQHWSNDEDLNLSHKLLIATLRSASDDESIKAFVLALASHLQQILQIARPEEFKTALLRTLADTSREVPFWRPLFGVETKLGYAANISQMNRDSVPDSVLDLARRVITTSHFKDSTSEQMRCALRLIANTCADNNVNRSIVINRDGIEDLLELLRKRRECDLVIPVLYNVCIDYDEPATDAHSKPLAPPPQLQSALSETSATPVLSAAEQRLGTYWFLYEDKTSFEILLSARDHARDCTETIADLLEMASRVALYGIDNFIQESDGRDPDEMYDTDTAADIVRLLVVEGSKLIGEDDEGRLSICQAVLNVLTQPQTHATIVNGENLIHTLVHLPYPFSVDGMDDEDQQIYAPYQKEFLKLIYSLSGAESYSQAVTPKSSLVDACLNAIERYSVGRLEPDTNPQVGPLASYCVLLANCITTTERAEKLLEDQRIIIHLPTLLGRVKDTEVLLPAVDLAARLTLSPKGQEAFSNNEPSMFPVIAKILHDRASEVDATGLEIQRNVVALTRLLIKGQGRDILCKFRSTTDHVVESTSLGREIIALGNRTSDARTKAELGRLFIETLRITHSPNGSSTTNTDVVEETESNNTTAESFLLTLFHDADLNPSQTTSPRTIQDLAADIISSIITESNPPAQPPSHSPSPSETPSSYRSHRPTPLEAETYFGLGLLSILPSFHPSLRRMLARNNFTLLTQLRDIVKSNNPSLLLKSHSLNPSGQDPRYENIKVLVVNLLQPRSWSASHNSKTLGNGDEAENDGRVKVELEDVAAEMGLDWVVV